MKEFHIINVGNSLLSNFQRNNPEISKIQQSDNDFWKKAIDDVNFMEEIFRFLESNPKERSAEMNTFLRVVEGKNPKEIEVYLSGTNTYSNEICVRTIQRYLRDKNFIVYDNPEFPGYFLEVNNYDEKYAKDEFVRGIAEMVDRFIYLALKKKEEGYEVFMNPTGGFKAHVIACALAGFLTGCKVYYMNEEFRNVIFMPELFYLPKGREVKLLEILSDRRPRSGAEYKSIADKFVNELERLRVYGLVDVETDDDGKPFRVKITARGILFLNTSKEVQR
ncbi:CRISPR-associated protein, APE2256 family [Candidatus Kryptonium thompsonii]|jgi:putative CRISPR-associated protein (TIGR02619 family)|uniref:CRISPR-associated protein, APE2256 family n=1 Tax=Candidatus Kryptonium thompsonii TaxID=1633631 RepID=A0A0P1LMR7_9BACT|nr:putative CRISPR-associated protein [Candidatus Kryptonium thompsoni]CUS82496.1 CRISPR-associated protein, APE2256 family [Candidatus Kryptonium thompsoni]CUS82690.1 CRISPR-associated protein, APE2256 family [Candidatus Kryptonium thompsoni]CUS87580.1 CRISPR-associated protein, APE2256 family [Candidatus Kryptonium thompsoni]CUS91171.1 CRISPR-associated protein, APE2256 family [Candidatus Kryptonium thompsoni]CUS94712.1 CRISPR-associated protein, APE2256 family [Candidatus Kryptonium thompso